METFLPFVRAGLESEQLCVVMGDDRLMDDMRAGLYDLRLDPDRYVLREQLLFMTAFEHYCRESRLNVDRLLKAAHDLVHSGASQGFRWVRVASDNTPIMDHVIQSAVQWLRYEARLNLILQGGGVVWMCAYDEQRTPGQVLSGLLKTHALVVMDGVLHENPFYCEPETFLGRFPQPNEIT
jgi:hypothetical protein